MSEVSFVTGTNVTLTHGFFKRHGGVSEQQFTSLNATARVGDSEENAVENRKRACVALGVDPASVVFLDRLPHGDENIHVSKTDAGNVINDRDAIYTTEKNLPIMMAVADCNPVIITDNATFVALVHSGWRGTKANIVGKTIDVLSKQLGVEAVHMAALIGPSIAPQDYPVQEDVAAQFDKKYLQDIDGDTHLDLWTAVEDQLKAAGIGSIENLRLTTYKSGDYFSFREDSGDTGRFMAIAQL